MLRPSSMEAKPTLQPLMSVALCGLFLIVEPIFADARISTSGSSLTAVLLNLPLTPKTAPPATVGGRWRRSTKDNMALGENTVHLRAWKLLPTPIAQAQATEAPEHSEEKLDTLVDELGLQPVRYYVPKMQAAFQSFDLREHYPDAKESIAYALTSFEAEEPTTATLQLRTSNSVRVWINGELVLTQPAPKFGRAVTTTADITLDTEETIILVECQQGGKNWGFSLGVSKLEKTDLQASNRTASP